MSRKTCNCPCAVKTSSRQPKTFLLTCVGIIGVAVVAIAGLNTQPATHPAVTPPVSHLQVDISGTVWQCTAGDQVMRCTRPQESLRDAWKLHS